MRCFHFRIVERGTDSITIGIFALSVSNIMSQCSRKYFFYCTPEELNKVELTVKLWKQDAQVTGILNNFLHKRFLFKKIRLAFHNVTAAATQNTWFTFLALSTQLLGPDCSVNATFQKDMTETLWLIGEIWVVRRPLAEQF